MVSIPHLEKHLCPEKCNSCPKRHWQGSQGLTFFKHLINLDSVSTLANEARVEEACPKALIHSSSTSKALLPCLWPHPSSGCPFVWLLIQTWPWVFNQDWSKMGEIAVSYSDNHIFSFLNAPSLFFNSYEAIQWSNEEPSTHTHTHTSSMASPSSQSSWMSVD